MAEGRFKFLAMLSPGPNRLIIRPGEDSAGSQEGELKLELTYTPLLDTPPLHLAIMVGKDSPLLIDCPPSKHAGVSSAHASLDAAIVKFRMTAYMWQALTAEDMRTKQLGRRSFRLDEAWAPDTTSACFLDTAHVAGAMRATARVHLVPSEHTVQEIRDADLAQQNEHGRRRHSLHVWFTDALRAYARTNPSFARSARPVVAGLILDAHYSASQELILGHAALGTHDPAGLSLGVMGSHLTYAWPRFLEEVTACLLDARAPGDGFVGNDNGECGTLWEACAVGQGAFLHEVGHAFGAPHTSGIMARGYAVHWPRNFVARTAWCARDREEGALVDDEENQASWDLRDALRFALLPHFWIPDDGRRPKMSPETRAAAPAVVALFDGDEEYGLHGTVLKVTSPSRIATIQWNDMDRLYLVPGPISAMLVTEKELEAQYSREEPLRLTVIGMNGKERTVRDVWRLLSDRSVVRIPGAGFALQKRSVMAKLLETEDEDMQKKQFWHWATLLHKRKENGKLTRASRVDVRTGCILDGAYVYYADQTRVNCGPRFSYPDRKHKHTFGGHQSEEIVLPEDQEIVKIEVSREEYVLGGMRIHLSNGDSGGQLNAENGTETLLLGK